MEYGPFGLEGHIRYHYFNSIEGLDRYQSIVVNDIPLEDERLWLQLTFLYDLPIENLKLGLNADKIYRWSDIDDHSYDMNESRFFARLVFEF
ncbi:hypothetical protein [Desulforhabdus amnigena]|nr:hypothetical protein [Desulforhabdus amnigena]